MNDEWVSPHSDKPFTAKDAFQELIVWANIRNIHKMRLVQQMYIWLFALPVVANALEKLPDPITLEIWGQRVDLTTRLPFSWQLFYFAAVCFVISNLIYQLRCPRVVKDHPNFATFLDERKGVSHLEWYRKVLKAPMAIKRNHQERLIQDLHFQQSFWEIHAFGNLSSFYSRLFAGLLLLLGFASIGFVLAQGVWSVFRLNWGGA